MHRLTPVALLVIAAAASLAWRAEQPPEKSTKPRHPDANIHKLDWLAGDWRSYDTPLDTGETWLAPKGGAMFGVSHTYKSDKIADFEFLRIMESAESGLIYYAQPRGNPPTPFKLKELSEKKFIFTNDEHDFPKTVEYWIDADNILHAKVAGTMDGKDHAIEWRWKRTTK